MSDSPPLELCLVRHGQTTWNATGRWQGHADAPLSELGREQAERLADRLGSERFDVVISSDLSRAFDTAQAVARRIGLEVQRDVRWREIDVGDLSGLTSEEAAAKGLYRTNHRFDERHPSGESSADLAARVALAVNDLILGRMGQRVLVVSHGGTIRRALAVILGEPSAPWVHQFRALGNTGIARFELFANGERRCLLYNDTAHLVARFVPAEVETEAASV